MSLATSENFKTPEATLAFSDGLFNAKSVMPGSEPKYGATLIFSDNDDRTVFNNAVKTVIVEAWGEKGLERAKNGGIKLPFLDGNGPQAKSKQTGIVHAGFGPGTWFIRVTSGIKYPPHLRWRDRNMQATEQEIYSGCRGFAVLNAFAWSNPQGGQGVSFGIAMFQKTSDGNRIDGGGRVDPADWFDAEAAKKAGNGKDGEASSSSSSAGASDGRGAGGLFD
jgi:hypothetical protein